MCAQPAFPTGTANCALTAAGYPEDETAGSPCSAFTASWFDAADSVVASNVHIDQVALLNGGGVVEAGVTLGSPVDHVTYACASACPGAPASCAWPAETRSEIPYDYTRWDPVTETELTFQMQRVALVVDGIGVTVQFTGDPADTFGTGPMMVVLPGAGADKGITAAESVRSWFETRAGVDTAVVNFEEALPIHDQDEGVPGGWTGGWQARSQSGGSTYHGATARVAEVLAWIHDHLAETTQPFVTLGCSMGCLGTISGPLWHGQTFYDYQMFVGGPPMWDINAGCGRLPALYALPVAPADLTNLGGVRLTNATFCNDPLDSACIPYTAVESSVFVNHIYGLPTGASGCQDEPLASDDPLSALVPTAIRASTASQWASFDHPVSFFVSSDDGMVGPGSAPSDDVLAGPSATRVANKLRNVHPLGPSAVTWSEDPGTHCDAFNGEPAAHRVRDRMDAVLALPTTMFDLRLSKDTEGLFTASDACLMATSYPPANQYHTAPGTVDQGGGRFEMGPYLPASNLQATLPSGTTISLGAGGLAVERVMFVTGGSRDGSVAGAEASYTVSFTYKNAPVGPDIVVVDVPVDDTSVHPATKDVLWSTTRFLGMSGNGATGCGPGGDVVTVFNPRGYDGGEVVAITIEYPDDHADPAMLGGPLALTIWTDSAGYTLGAPGLEPDTYTSH